MSISNELTREAIGAYETFKIASGESFGPYASVAENEDVMATWAKDNLPDGLRSLEQIGAWEICFRQTVTSLKRDPSWRSQVEKTEAFKLETQFMPAAEYKHRLLSDPEFRRLANA
jgi:hypothetical protein